MRIPHRRRPSARLVRVMVVMALVTTGYAVASVSIGWWSAATRAAPGLVVVRAVLVEGLITMIYVTAILRLLGRGVIRPWQRAASEDELTGVLRAGTFWDRAETVAARAHREGQSLAFVFFDVDNFKAINDTYGHAVGDAVLHALGGVLRRSIRQGDILGRLGGEEFGWLMAAVTADDARIAAERVLIRCQTLSVHGLKGIGLSGGLAVATNTASPPITAWDLARRADRGLYQAKTHGKGRIIQVP